MAKKKTEISDATINKIIMHMETGVIESPFGHMRKYDVIDFYLMSKMDHNSFLQLVNQNYSDKYKIVSAYFARNKDYLTGSSIKQDVRDLSYQYGDHVLTEEEKEKIIKFLSDNKLPINVATYFYTANKYVEGIINFETTKVKIKKKK